MGFPWPDFLIFIDIILRTMMPLSLFLITFFSWSFVLFIDMNISYINTFTVRSLLLKVFIFFFFTSFLFFPSLLGFSPLSFLSLFFLLCLQNKNQKLELWKWEVKFKLSLAFSRMNCAIYWSFWNLSSYICIMLSTSIHTYTSLYPWLIDSQKYRHCPTPFLLFISQGTYRLSYHTG